MKKKLIYFSRFLTGLVFLFSGFVKAVDPLGSAYKFEEYFTAFGIEWLSPLALYLGVLLCLFEFLLGVALIFGIRMRFTTWVVLFFMSGFTMLTFWLALSNPVSDCGCFGDAIKMTNWQTFYKNVVIMVFVLILFVTRKTKMPQLQLSGEIFALLAGSAILLFVAIYSYNHLPLIDFLPWKKGNDVSKLVVPTPEEADVFLIYKNKTTGELEEYTAQTLPWQDSVHMNNLDFVEQRMEVTKPFEEAPIHDFVIMDAYGDDYTTDFIFNPDFQFILVVYDVFTTARKPFPKINELADSVQAAGYSFIGLSGSIYEEIEAFRHEMQTMYDFYNVDGTALKTMMRSNPGLVLLKNGVVIEKWHYRDIPEFKEIRLRYLNR